MAYDDLRSVEYSFRRPFMDKGVPSTQVQLGSYPELVGVNPSYNGCFRKFYGMEEILDISAVAGMDEVDDYGGVSYLRKVEFQKKGTSTIYQGFVVRWDEANNTSESVVDLVYSEDNGSTWTRKAIWATGNGITDSVQMSCAVHGDYLLVFVEGLATKTVYYTGSVLSVVESGPGSFSAQLGAMTKNAEAVDTSYHLNGDGAYQIAYRFYDSTRGIWSNMSDPLTVYTDQFKTSKALGTISFNSGGGDSGLMVAGDVFTINTRTYEYIDAGSDVTIAAAGAATIAAHAIALADAINGDSSATVTATAQATSVLLEAIARGSGGNSYGLSVTETGANTDDIMVSGSTFTGGGELTQDAQDQVKVTVDFPANTAVVAGEAYADFDALFDTVQVFRSIDMGTGTTAATGAILYLESSIAKAGNWATSGTWDSLTADVGSLPDDALVFQKMYDPEKDFTVTPPVSGVGGRYQGLTIVAQAPSVDGGYDILTSSPVHMSPEYFTTYNKRQGNPEYGRPIAFLEAGDSMFALMKNGVSHIYKSSQTRPLQIVNMHKGRGLVASQAAHSVGNSVVLMTANGLMILNGADGSMGKISSVDRIVLTEWVSDLTSVTSGYDAYMDTSMFLNPDDREILMVCHSTQCSALLEGANFAVMTHGQDVTNDGPQRAYFCTAKGLVVSPDYDESDTGTMWGLDSSYTINGTTTSSHATSLIDSNATFHADMVGARCYFTTGNNAGSDQEIATVDVGNATLTFSSSFTSAIVAGDQYSIAPVPLKVRLSKLTDIKLPDTSFRRWTMKGMAVMVQEISGITGNTNDHLRLGGYRNGSSTLHSDLEEVTITGNPADDVGSVTIDGIEIEPYIEQLAAGVSFELTDAEIYATMASSRNAN